jgi:hypothetical protein
MLSAQTDLVSPGRFEFGSGRDSRMLEGCLSIQRRGRFDEACVPGQMLRHPVLRREHAFVAVLRAAPTHRGYSRIIW